MEFRTALTYIWSDTRAIGAVGTARNATRIEEGRGSPWKIKDKEEVKELDLLGSCKFRFKFVARFASTSVWGSASAIHTRSNALGLAVGFGSSGNLGYGIARTTAQLGPSKGL